MLIRYGKADGKMSKEAKNTYEDIINMEHPTSKRHPRMTVYNRAAQFSPFAALTGHEEALKETARITDNKIELDENVKRELDYKLQQILNKNDFIQNVQKKSQENRFLFDLKMPYLPHEFLNHPILNDLLQQRLKDEYKKTVEFTDGKEIFIDDIISIEEETK